MLTAGYFFYGYWDWRFLGLLFLSSAIDFLLALNLGKTRNNNSRKILLYLSILFNLGILGFFKYFNFFISSLHDLLHLFHVAMHPFTLSIVLPVGISFYTFQSLSYIIDVYRGRLRPETNFLSYLTYVSFFPQLMAGPIERAEHMLKQFNQKKIFSYDQCVSGLRLILWGLFKKVVIADNLAQLTDVIFDPKEIPSGGLVILGCILFAFQIYGDFSGYSDMAIGLSKMLGFDIMRNFLVPYSSSSFTEFWRRWHVSLSLWFRDYVYIPLGGNVKGKIRTDINILITFLLSGLWHGARVTFLLWGGLHAFMLILEKSFATKTAFRGKEVCVFMIIALLWLPFRAESFDHLKLLLEAMVHFNGFFSKISETIVPILLPVKTICILIAVLLLVLLDKNLKQKNFDVWIKTKSLIFRYTIYYGLFIAVLLMGNFTAKPTFIYFQF